MKKTILFLFLAAGFFLFSNSAFGEDYQATIYASVNSPSQLSAEIWFWDGRTLPTPPRDQANPLVITGGSRIDYPNQGTYLKLSFSERANGKCLPGKTSWDDTQSGKPTDNFTSVAGNVGFTAHCLGPTGSTFNVSCGTMVNTIDSNKIIPYHEDFTDNGQTFGIDYFGFTCKTTDDLPSSSTGGDYVIGNGSRMQVHSQSGTSVSTDSNSYGHDFAVYNLLNVPATTVPGNYETNDASGHEHLRISWY